MNKANQSVNFTFGLLSSVITKNAIDEYNSRAVHWDSWADFVKKNGIATFVHLALKQNPHLAVPEAARTAVDKIL